MPKEPTSRSHYYNDNRYMCRLERVIDGDTVHLHVDLGLRVCRDVYLRLADIDTPEMRGGDEISRTRALAAKQALEGMLAVTRGSTVHKLLVRIRKGKSFDRWVGVLIIRSEDTKEDVVVNNWMVEQKHAVAVAP